MDPALSESLPVLTRAFQDCCQLASDSLFEGPGFAMPATPAKGAARNQVMDYAQVQGFLRMAEEALRARNGAVDLLQSQLAEVRAELHALQGQQSKVGEQLVSSCSGMPGARPGGLAMRAVAGLPARPACREARPPVQVQQAENSALEEAQQLSNLVQQLLVEKAEAATAMQKLQRERQYLSEENALLRHQLTAGATGASGVGHAGCLASAPRTSMPCAIGRPSPSGPLFAAESGAGDSELSPLGPHAAVLASLHESLEAEQGRAARAEDEAVLLRARVIALEKASVVRGFPVHRSCRRLDGGSAPAPAFAAPAPPCLHRPGIPRPRPRRPTPSPPFPRRRSRSRW